MTTCGNHMALLKCHMIAFCFAKAMIYSANREPLSETLKYQLSIVNFNDGKGANMGFLTVGMGVMAVPWLKVSSSGVGSERPGLTLNLRVTILTSGLQEAPMITLLEGVELITTVLAVSCLADAITPLRFW